MILNPTIETDRDNSTVSADKALSRLGLNDRPFGNEGLPIDHEHAVQLFTKKFLEGKESIRVKKDEYAMLLSALLDDALTQSETGLDPFTDKIKIAENNRKVLQLYRPLIEWLPGKGASKENANVFLGGFYPERAARKLFEGAGYETVRPTIDQDTNGVDLIVKAGNAFDPVYILFQIKALKLPTEPSRQGLHQLRSEKDIERIATTYEGNYDIGSHNGFIERSILDRFRTSGSKLLESADNPNTIAAFMVIPSLTSAGSYINSSNGQLTGTRSEIRKREAEIDDFISEIVDKHYQRQGIRENRLLLEEVK